MNKESPEGASQGGRAERGGKEQAHLAVSRLRPEATSPAPLSSLASAQITFHLQHPVPPLLHTLFLSLPTQLSYHSPPREAS